MKIIIKITKSYKIGFGLFPVNDFSSIRYWFLDLIHKESYQHKTYQITILGFRAGFLINKQTKQ